MLIQTAGPKVEPVSLAEARTWLRLDSDFTAEDALVSNLIREAREFAETICQRSFITQQWRLVLDSFPGGGLMGVPYGVTFSIPGHAITLDRGIVQSIQSIQYLNAGTWYTMDPANYVADLSGCPARITPVFGQIWPVISTPQIANIKIDYTAGYGDTAASVPAGIKTWMQTRFATLSANREQVAVLQRGKIEPLPYIDRMLDPFCSVRY